MSQKNRCLIVFVLSVFLLSNLKTQAQNSQESCILRSELIYSLKNKPTPQCHASTIVSTKKGLIAAWFGGKHEKEPDVGIWISKYENDSWTKPVEAANGVQSDTLRFPCWNPVLFKPEVGPLMLFYKVGPDPVNWWGLLKTSENYGKTWSDAVRLPENILGPIKNKPILLSNGYLLCPSSGEDEGWKVHFELTKNFGKTWHNTGHVKDTKGLSAIQPCILIHPGGSLQALCRSRKSVIAQTWSTDSGKTWSDLTPTSLPNPNSGIDAVTLKDSRFLLVYNHTKIEPGKWGGPRTPLNVAVSTDGINWNRILTLENEPGEYSYPAVIQSSDGLVHITYTYKRESIKHVVIDPEKIMYNVQR